MLSGASEPATRRSSQHHPLSLKQHTGEPGSLGKARVALGNPKNTGVPSSRASPWFPGKIEPNPLTNNQHVFSSDQLPLREPTPKFLKLFNKV